MGNKIMIVGAIGASLTAQIAEVLGKLDAVMVEDGEPIARAIELRPDEDFRVPTAKEFWVGGARTRGTKRSDIPRPKDLYRQRNRGGRP
jgi:hypothetical protein